MTIEIKELVMLLLGAFVLPFIISYFMKLLDRSDKKDDKDDEKIEKLHVEVESLKKTIALLENNHNLHVGHNKELIASIVKDIKELLELITQIRISVGSNNRNSK